MFTREPSQDPIGKDHAPSASATSPRERAWAAERARRSPIRPVVALLREEYEEKYGGIEDWP